MKPSPWLPAFLKKYERFRPTAYPATAAERAKGIWTIGYGHTKGVKEGDTCTMAEALAWLVADESWACDEVNRVVKVALTQNQFDALSSLCFNIGGPQFEHSTLVDMLNQGHYALAAAQFPRWDHQAGKELEGLLARRVAERQHFEAA